MSGMKILTANNSRGINVILKYFLRTKCQCTYYLYRYETTGAVRQGFDKQYTNLISANTREHFQLNRIFCIASLRTNLPCRDQQPT